MPPKETTTTCDAPKTPDVPSTAQPPAVTDDPYWRAVAERTTNPFTADKRR
jgi:hypothetical protein